MACLLDTSILIDAERDAQVLDRLDDEETQLISVITASELLHGVHRANDSTRRGRREAFVEQMLGAFDVIPITLEVARIHASIGARLASSGDVIGPHDLWIAATAISHGLRVATTNAREFERVPGLDLLAL
ncbi:MAG: PIN domain-containing protein [Solirubrobacterales bacterium]|nr:PIN domain-containing protein [Solirubrobacterales bacterium]